MAAITENDVLQALSHVVDPELDRSLTELDMVKSVRIDGADVHATILLTIAGCPLKGTLVSDSVEAIEKIPGVENAFVDTEPMTDDQRRELRIKLRGHEPVIPFSQPDSTTRVLAVASGKGGVGKSSVTVNVATALAKRGLNVGVLDADIYGHSIPQMMGDTNGPHQVDDMIMPPICHGVKIISIGHFVKGNSPVIWRGPMLHRAIQQFLTDVFWGDLDVLLLDLPPGTGDVAISVAQLIPGAELLIVTTPQAAAAEVAERAGSISQQTKQKIAGVIENMSAMIMPDGTTIEIFGSGGGQTVADRLTQITGARIPLLGSIPLDPTLRTGGDAGVPVAISQPDSPAGKALNSIAEKLVKRKDSLLGKTLGLGIAHK